MLHDENDLGLIASAARGRVAAHRLQRERDAAIRRVRAGQNLTAAWKPLSSAFLSAKAKLQPRDSKGRWIDMGASVRWLSGSQIGGNKKKLSGVHGNKSYSQGEVRGYDAKTKKYQIEPDGGGKMIELEGKDLEVIKAVIPDSPEQVKADNESYDAEIAKDLLQRGTPEMNRRDDEEFARQAREREFRTPPPRTADDDWEPDPAAEDATIAADPRKALAERAGLTDEEMADAPELLPAVENLRNSVTRADFLSQKDLDDFNDRLDEVQVAPGGRSPGQWDSIDEFLDERMSGAGLDEDDFDNVLDTRSAARRDSLDGPGDTTIADLEKAVDQPDKFDTGVPQEWAEEEQNRQALSRLKPLTDEEKAAREAGWRANEEAAKNPPPDPEVGGPHSIGDRVTANGKSGIITGGRPDGERYTIEADDGEKFGAHSDDIQVDQSMDDALNELTKPEGDAPADDPGRTATDDNGESIEIGDKVNWKQGIFGADENTVVDIDADGKIVVENKWGERSVLGSRGDEPVAVTKSEPDVEMTPEVKDVLAKLDNDARMAGFSNDGYDKAASGREGAYRETAKLVRKKGLTPEVVAELRRRAEQDGHKNDYAGFDDHNPYYSGSSKTYEKIALDIEKRLPKTDSEGSPAGNITEFAKNMFQNLHPDANWDEADQTTWLDAAKKAMEKPND